MDPNCIQNCSTLIELHNSFPGVLVDISWFSHVKETGSVFCLICIHRCVTNLLTWTLLTYQKLLKLRMELSGVFLLINNKLSVYVLLHLMKVIKIDSSLFLFWHLTNSKDISIFIYRKQNKFTLNWCCTVKKCSCVFHKVYVNIWFKLWIYCCVLKFLLFCIEIYWTTYKA